MTMQSDEGAFDCDLNGVNRSGGTTAAGAACITWDTSDNFETSDLKTKLDAMVSKINESHPDAVIDYAVSGNSITFYQLHGGELQLSNYKTNTAYATTRFDVTPAAGQGTATDLYYEGHTVIGTTGTATASGTNAVATTAQIQFSGDDRYGLTISNGENSYTMAATMLDVGSAASADAFNDALEEALVGSGISSSMSSNGSLMLTRADGGSIYLTSFSSANGGTGTWTPGAGQGSATSLPGNGALTSASSSSSSSTASGGSSVAQVTVATQSGAEAALATIDSALDYVNSERSKLGAIANRLNHTVDNLSNVVAATEASRSRILDTDYAAETAELARAQIIQQAATAMLAQANQQPQTVLALLQ